MVMRVSLVGAKQAAIDVTLGCLQTCCLRRTVSAGLCGCVLVALIAMPHAPSDTLLQNFNGCCVALHDPLISIQTHTPLLAKIELELLGVLNEKFTNLK